MRLVRSFQTKNNGKKICIGKISKHISRSFSEDEIIEIQNEFLTVGFHKVSVHSVSTGRAFMYTFLHSLNCFAKIACITDSVMQLHQAENLYMKLKDMPFSDQEAWQTFFVEDFYYDFLWVESTESLKPWVSQLKGMIQAHGIDKQLCIMELLYT